MGDVVRLSSKKRGANRVRLTKTVVDRFVWDRDGTSWQILWDTEIENMGVRVRAKSKKWVLRYRNAEGIQRMWTFGSPGQITVRQARKIAEEANARIVLGEDPSAEKQQARQGPDDDTFRTLARLWIDDYAKQKRRSWKTDEARLLPDPESETDPQRAAEKRRAPVNGLHEIRPGHHTRDDFEDALQIVHDQLSESTPVEADRVVQTVNACLNWNVKRRNVPRTFMNIAEVIDANGSNPREAHLRPNELSKFAKALRSRPLRWRAAIWLMLLTGSRSKSEVLSLRWEDVHLDAGEFIYRNTKNGKQHRLPMTAGARSIFETLPRDSAWVFPARSGDGPRQDSRAQFNKIRSDGGFIDRITPHALRHTARTYLETKLKLPGPIVDAVLNHSTQGMAGTYTHVGIDDVRVALAALERFVVEKSGVERFEELLLLEARKKRP